MNDNTTLETGAFDDLDDDAQAQTEELQHSAIPVLDENGLPPGDDLLPDEEPADDFGDGDKKADW